ncbi:mechanosensitive ion channel family protein [Azohydromonas aeria]|uniref:mechanosensitive ion channel family protein n=1 Tax=Azohydromonas aeria TaxID=2590212 RepID=UPI0012F7D7EB|nr:mechanosensitive ion channel family protein [Azohydromonas aeria]
MNRLSFPRRADGPALVRLLLPLLWLALLVLGPVPGAAAQGVAPAAISAPARDALPGAEPALLRVMNRDVVLLRAMLGGVAPQERVERARARIARQLAAGGPLAVTVWPVAGGQGVYIDGAFCFAVLDADTDPLQPPGEAPLVRQAAAALERALAERRESRDVRAMAESAGRSAAASGVALVLGFGLARLGRRAQARALRWTARQASRLPLHGAALLLRERLAQAVPALLRGLTLALGGLIGYAWLSVVLAQFPYTRRWGEQLNERLLAVLAELLGGIAAALPGLLTALLMFVLARWATQLCRAFFARVRSGQIRLGWLDPELADATARLSNTLIWLFALAMAYPYLPGSQTEAFKGLSVLLGLMLSLGASSLVGQGASGLILAYSRVLRRGEYVRVAEHEGTVTDTGLFTTRIRTGLGEELTVPNALILGNVTRNYSRTVRGPGFILDTTVTIGYDTPWREVEAMLLEAARRTEGVLREPAPRVFQTALSDFYPEYRLVCQAIPAAPRPRAEVLDALHAHIQDVFAERGVQIMSPHYLGDPAEAKVPPRAAVQPARARAREASTTS